jgi:Relaxase/Mobilisation nuclease domain
VIANQTFGDDFGDLGDYLRRGRGRVDPSQRVGWVEFRNLPTRRMDIAERIMEGTASLSCTRQPVFHLSISFAPGDAVDEVLIKRVMARTLADLGLGEHQAVIVAHIDTDDPHVHAMVNRVHPETGVAWKGSWSRLRVEASLRRQELDEGLRVVPGWLARVPGHPELRPRPRLARADEEFLREVRERAGSVLKRAQSWADVEAGLAEFGLSVRVNGRGMSVTDGRQEVKASEVGPQFSRGNLEEQFGRYSDYRARVAVASAISVRDTGGASPARVGIESKAQPETRAASDAQPRFSLYEDDGIFGVWDSRGPQFFFADTRERAEAEMRRAEWLVVRYPNIRAVRCLRDMDVECRKSRGLPLLPEGTGRPPRTVHPVPAAETAVQPVARVAERSDPAPAPAPAPVRRDASFRDEVRSKAESALRLSDSWAELEHELAELGLFLRVKGGGFVVTDGERKVKASDVGREFSRFYLEKRLGRYPDPHMPVTATDVAPVAPTPAVQPETPAQYGELPKHKAPAAAPRESEEIADAPRFTLFEDEGIFGVYDSAVLQVFFAETRERALEEVERANQVVALYPNTISMRHLREMDGAWRDARGLPRLPEPEGPTISVPWPTRVPAEAAPASVAHAGTASAHEISAPASSVERAAEQVDELVPPPSTEPVREEVAIQHLRPEPQAHRVLDHREVQARRSSSPAVDSLQEDQAVAAAVRAFMALEDAREARAQARRLREERRPAEEVLAELEDNEKALKRTRRDFRATAARVYRDPAAAMTVWDALVHRASGNLEAAGERVRKNPHILGPLLTDPPSSVWDSAREMVGLGSTRMARQAVPQMLHRAFLHAPALREATKPVEWTAPDGRKVEGREKVRSVATDIVSDRSGRIKAIEEWVQELGGISGAERKVQRAFTHLSSVQRNQAARKIGAATGITEASVAAKITEVLDKAHRAARLARSLGEGPGGL